MPHVAILSHVVRLNCCMLLVGLLFGLPGLSPADDQIKTDVLTKVKLATVRLKVTQADGTQVEGSGFFGGGPGLVLTNAHVLGMLRAESRKPKQVDVIINSGEPNEKTLRGNTLGVDGSSDLAVLGVVAKDIPAFLPLGTGDELRETQAVFVFGFPFGESLGKNVTVSKTSVSSLRKNDFGKLTKIQVNGGMNPGNSGGPVIDGDGKVVAVAVSGIKGTQINFAIPARLVHSFLSGRVSRTGIEAPYKDGDKAKAVVNVETIDPLRRIKQVRVDTWTGDPGKAHLIGEKERDPKPGESPRVSTNLEYGKDGIAHGELTLPDIPKGKVLWTEFHVLDGNGRDTWTTASPQNLAPPLDRTATKLTYKHTPGRRGWNVVAETALKVRDPEGTDHDLVFKNQADIIQTLNEKSNPFGESTAILTFNKPQIALKIDGKEIPLPKEEVEVLKQITQVQVLAKVNGQGEFVSYRPDFKKVPMAIREDIASFTLGLLKSFDAARPPLPTEEVAFGKPWKGTRELMIGSTGPAETAISDITYNFMGTRVRREKGEALLTLNGKLRGQKGEGSNLGGKMKGDAAFDLATGQLVFANTTVDLDLDLGEGRTQRKASGTHTVHLFQIIFNTEPTRK